MDVPFTLKIGSVIYTETDSGIHAEWFYYKDNALQQGKGFAKRLSPVNKQRRFEGDFIITYSDANEVILAQLHLQIRYVSEYYRLTWKNKEHITDWGIGVERGHTLVASYTEKSK